MFTLDSLHGVLENQTSTDHIISNTPNAARDWPPTKRGLSFQWLAEVHWSELARTSRWFSACEYVNGSGHRDIFARALIILEPPKSYKKAMCKRSRSTDSTFHLRDLKH
ncbi:hypothetical protein LOAG_08224 [Loa loa]|uniref:Uncharacterized protein n=1 Tax=Loa loa TaxID=7209 RepID=A0A1S0TUN5_LOALO|nr:hypothetical protein LOAG_08224 [Loa loa]EFO20268.1 hypothetical protein LOAG_08224 [Loa loa]